jgi:branched-chain amino acid transport system permease protein
MNDQRSNWLVWAIPIGMAIVLPLVFRQGFSLSLFCQMGINIIFALSYNMLLGQTGMLSFGHAVYFGLAAYFCAHALNAMGQGGFNFPVTLLPLIGGLTGLVFGVILGYITTKRSGTPFAMISLGIGELVAAGSQMFPGFFGGEAGISTNRVAGAKAFGITYGPQIQVYYLIAGWALLSAIAMYAFTKTPLGRMANAVRDNAERAQFVGYDPQRVRYLVFIVAGFFAGVAGSLSAINFEIVTVENVGLATSGFVLFMAFIGGTGSYYGPVIGAILVTFLQVALSGYTKAWLLYLGLFFLLMVLFAPGGIASLIELHRPAWRARQLSKLVPGYLAVIVPILIAFAGLVGLIEMIYFVETSGGGVGDMRLLGINVDASRPTAWIVCLALVAIGFAGFRWLRPQLLERWDAVSHTLRAADVQAVPGARAVPAGASK